MRRMKKIVTVLMALSLTVTGMLGSGMTAKADSCGGLAEEDVYTPGEDEVIKDPLLHWAIRSSMNAIKSNVKLTADMVGINLFGTFRLNYAVMRMISQTGQNHTGLKI